MHQATKIDEIYLESIKDLASADLSQLEEANRLITRVRLIEDLMARVRQDEPRNGVLFA